MIRPTRTARLVVMAAASALVLASCGSDEPSSTPQAGNDTGASSTTKAECETKNPQAAQEVTPPDFPPDKPTPAEKPTPVPPKSGDGVLHIGSLLPTTGDLASLGPPEIAGVETAVEDINAAGGVLGKPVKYLQKDSGDGTPSIAPGSVDQLLSAKSDVVLGAASSSVSLSVIDKIISAGVTQFSPAATSAELDTIEDKDMFFRTSPSDVLQGAVLSNAVVGDGHSNVAILARQDSYGEGLASEVEKGIKAGGATVAAKVLYSADASNYTAEVTQIADSNPDAVVLIAFEETTKIVPQLIAKNIGPADLQVYFTDGNINDYSKDFDKCTLYGVKATLPGAPTGDEFKKRLLKTDPKLPVFSYGPEAYDAAVLSALAAEQAGDDGGKSIASQLTDVSRGGEKCTTFEECAALIKKGTNIDYDGFSGPVEFNETGSPSVATIGIYQFGADNTYHNISYSKGAI
ncbi:MAG: ABC transporter substrate-binding protein [Propionibacteriales bacterium]|nr:ABC transporter substrate-binding protein [Propionibacteriales bacterium]